jgi:hypothetical protein
MTKTAFNTLVGLTILFPILIGFGPYRFAFINVIIVLFFIAIPIIWLFLMKGKRRMLFFLMCFTIGCPLLYAVAYYKKMPAVDVNYNFHVRYDDVIDKFNAVKEEGAKKDDLQVFAKKADNLKGSFILSVTPNYVSDLLGLDQRLEDNYHLSEFGSYMKEHSDDELCFLMLKREVLSCFYDDGLKSLFFCSWLLMPILWLLFLNIKAYNKECYLASDPNLVEKLVAEKGDMWSIHGDGKYIYFDLDIRLPQPLKVRLLEDEGSKKYTLEYYYYMREFVYFILGILLIILCEVYEDGFSSSLLMVSLIVLVVMFIISFYLDLYKFSRIRKEIKNILKSEPVHSESSWTFIR